MSLSFQIIHILYHIYSMYIHFFFSSFRQRQHVFVLLLTYTRLINCYSSFLENQKEYSYLYVCTTVILFYIIFSPTISFFFWVNSKFVYFTFGWHYSSFFVLSFVICFFFFFLCTCDTCEMRENRKETAFCFCLFLVNDAYLKYKKSRNK
jgi:hypothetical protein